MSVRKQYQVVLCTFQIIELQPRCFGNFVYRLQSKLALVQVTSIEYIRLISVFDLLISSGITQNYDVALVKDAYLHEIEFSLERVLLICYFNRDICHLHNKHLFMLSTD